MAFLLCFAMMAVVGLAHGSGKNIAEVYGRPARKVLSDTTAGKCSSPTDLCVYCEAQR